MADGQEKQINAIRVGEKVFSVSGKAVRVMDIIVGIEEKVVVLVTQSGKRIRLTSDHPVRTEQRGIQRVNALLATSIFSKIIGVLPPLPRFQKRGNMCLIL